jgi:hypothetical protein
MEEQIPIHGTPGLKYGKGKDNRFSCLGIEENAEIDYSKPIYIASEIFGQTVVQINNDAFKNNQKIKYIYIPDSVKYI